MKIDLFLKESELEDYYLLKSLKEKEVIWKRRGHKCAADRETKFFFIANLKTQMGCFNCKEDNYRALEIHHVNSKEKEFNFNRCYYFSWKEILDELKKCEVLCSNCHKKEG